MGGQVVYGNDEFKNLSPELPPASPDWSPTGVYGYGGANLANTILSTIPMITSYIVAVTLSINTLIP